ncbi:molybdopterin-containing oxidoreductase family protein [Sphingorhabdus contaminans]|uniref:Molybdopterin-dependent oxidoreductase n=1 Tax=Sphingorhabdus contaminans TaxID=1343899 RepID=A0A553WCB0_9SPHN|nr:molybdopterin-dependent oxidoreductase [Sphingorhabdus contaminans]TSB02330.1 molybdopterin-dependent oxidoreductase [Sphingorhabdus contaminans]
MTWNANNRSKPGEDGLHPTYCRLCEAQCGLLANVEKGKITKILPDRDHPASQGHLCIKGPGMVDVMYDQDRVTNPLKRNRVTGEFEPVDWDTALRDIAARLIQIIQANGADAIATYLGNPAAFSTLHIMYARMFLAKLGADKIFSPLHADTGAQFLAEELVYGSPAHHTFADLESCDFLIMIGANPMVSHFSMVTEPLALHKLNEIHARGGVVVIDPRRTETAKRFEHIAIRPDSDAWLLCAILNHIFAGGLANTEILRQRTDDWEQLRDALQPFSPEIASLRCGIDAASIRQLAERFAKARTSACYGRLGTCRGRFSTLTNLLIEYLNIACGRFGVPGGWVIGDVPFSALATKTPAHDEAQSRVSGLPSLMGFMPSGSIAAEIATPGKGQVRALFVDSGNPLHSYPDPEAAEAAFAKLDLLVSIDFYVNETGKLADYILPAPTFYERADLTLAFMANAPRPWVQFTPEVIPPLGEARLEADIYNEILGRMGLPRLFSAFATTDRPQPELMDIADQMLRRGPYGDQMGKNPDGLSIAKLRDWFPHGIRLAPGVNAQESWNRIQNERKRPQLWPDLLPKELARLLSDPKNDDETLLLFGRRSLGSLNTWMHNVERLVRGDRPTLLMHPDDAAPRNIADGDMVRVSSKTGSVLIEAEMSYEVVRGSACYPHGWGHDGGWRHANSLPGANFNVLASSDPRDWEQVSAVVHLDGIKITVSRAEGSAAMP